MSKTLAVQWLCSITTRRTNAGAAVSGLGMEPHAGPSLVVTHTHYTRNTRKFDLDAARKSLKLYNERPIFHSESMGRAGRRKGQKTLASQHLQQEVDVVIHVGE